MASVTFERAPGSDRLGENRDFRNLFIGGAAAKLGAHVSYVALPLAAVEALGASPGEVGLLASLATAAALVFGLPAGAWIDRVRKRRIMVAADLVRAVLMASVPSAWALGALTMWQLYLVVFLAGVGTVAFDVSQQSLLPSIVDRERLTGANARLVALDSGLGVGGRSAAGFLVALLGAPLAVAADAFGYVCSALFVRRIRSREAPSGPRASMAAEVRAGIGFVWRHRALRAMAASGAVNNCSIAMFLAMLPVVWVGADLPAAGLGVLLGAGGAGSFAGAAVARRLRDRLGTGRALWAVGAAAAPLALSLPLVGPGPGIWVVGLAWALVCAAVGTANVVGVSLRQQATPDELLGRMNAVFRFVLMGAVAAGAAVSGLVGEVASPRTAMWAAAAGMASQWVILFAARRSLR